MSTPGADGAPATSPSSLLVIAARPDPSGLAAAQVFADRVGGTATHAGAAGLDHEVRAAARVIVLDPGTVRARLTRDRAFTATAAPGARRDLIMRLAPYQDRVRWMSRPA
jgi:hypothetical protein